MFSDVFGNEPGFISPYETYERVFRWNKESLGVITNGHISGAARDVGNTGDTSSLRVGLLLGRIGGPGSTGLLTNYSATATDGSNYVEAVLLASVRTVTVYGATNTPKWWGILVAGPVKAAGLIGLDNVARSQMRGRFLLDDDVSNTRAYNTFHREINKATNYTVVALDAGTLFTASAAATFTLPAKSPGLGPFGFLNLADANMVIASAGSGTDIVADGLATANTVTFGTSSHKIGSFVKVYCNAAGTKWYVENLGGTLETVA